MHRIRQDLDCVFKCRSDQHLLADCPFKKSTQGKTGHTTANQPARVNACVQAADVRYANTDTAMAEVTGRSADDCPPAVESADRPDNTGTGSAAVTDVQSCVTGLSVTSADARVRESKINAMRSAFEIYESVYQWSTPECSG